VKDEDDLGFRHNAYDRLMSMEALTGPQTDRDGVDLHKMLFNPLFFSSNKDIVVILI